MKPKTPLLLLFALGLTLLFQVPARAEHRATRLGYPNTRLAAPLKSPEDLRKRFRDEKLKPDIASILKQWGWKGNLEDLYYAALTAEITEVQLPVGTRMPFMSTRENGRPIILVDVVWAGSAPVGAYVFNFASNTRKYRCVVPKPCSNFYVEDLGAELPILELTQLAPPSVLLCDPWPMKVIVRNLGEIAATQVKVTESLPAGLKTSENQTSLRWDIGVLPPGSSREFTFYIVPSSAGTFLNQAQATSFEGVTAEAESSTIVQAPVLALECHTPGRIIMGHPAEVCMTVLNTGTAAERKSTLTLPVPEDFTIEGITEGGVSTAGLVSWEITDLAPNESRKFCATIIAPREPGELTLVPSIRGNCSPMVHSTCTTEVEAVSGILVEVIDLVDPVEVGQEVNYEIAVTNQGLLTGTNLRLICSLPASQEFVSGSGPTSARMENGKIVFAPLPSLVGKSSTTWQIVTKALSADDARFSTELRSDQFERPILEMEATQQY